MRRTRWHANTQWQALQVTARSPRDGPGRVTQSGTHAGTHLGLAGLTSHDHGTGYQLSTNALTGKLLQGPGITREREMHGSITAPSATTRRTRSARSARSSTPTHRLAHLTRPHPPTLPSAARQWHCGSTAHNASLQLTRTLEPRSASPTHGLPHSSHTRARRRPHAHDARHASALRASHSFGRASERFKRF